MISMTKVEMLRYLKDYADIQCALLKNPEIPIGKIFGNYMLSEGRIEKNTIEYYDRMRRVYMAYNLFKTFSIDEDFLLNRDDFLSNNDLDGIEKECNIITAPSGLTNKMILKLIRNAFNHNDSKNIERFKISLNGKNYQIEFADIRTPKEIENGVKEKPVKIKFNLENLIRIDKIMESKRQNQIFYSYDIPDDFDMFSDNLDVELDKVRIIRYYFTKKLSSETIKKFKQLADIKELTKEELLERSKQLHALSKTIAEPVQFELDSFQKEKVKELINRYKNSENRIFLDEELNPTMYYFLEKVVPVPAIKKEIIDHQLIICESYMFDPDITQNEILERVARVGNKVEPLETYNETDKMIHNMLGKKTDGYLLRLFKNLLDGEFVQVFPIITFIDAVVMHYCTDSKIKIDGKVYDKEKIRNSFAHGRWYIGDNLTLMMYDADPRNINDYKLEFVGRIDIRKFMEWANEYMAKSINKIKERTIDSSINKRI